MPAQQRFMTDYPGVYYITGKAVATGKPEKIYYIDYRKDGKRIQEKAGRQYQDDMTPAKANRIRINKIEGRDLSNVEKRAVMEAAKKAESERLTIAKLWDSYCESNPDNKALSHDKRKFDLYLRYTIGKKEPNALLPLDVDRIRLSLQKSGKRTQAARVLEILRRTINYGIKRGLVDPLRFKIEVPRLNNTTTEDLTSDQLKALLGALNADEDQQAANIMRLALFTGMRRSEIFRLQWSDLDFQRKFITIRDPKGGRDQSIPMNEMVEQIFNGIEPKEDNPHVFPGRRIGAHITECRKSIERIRKTAKLPVGFRPLHGLRHVYASILASSGRVDLYTLQRLLTHKSPLMTQRYAHLADESLKRASDVAAEIIGSTKTTEDEKEKSHIESHTG